MNTIIKKEISGMSIDEKIHLVEDIWDMIADSEEELSLTPSQKIELDKRLENYCSEPDSGMSWDKLKKELLI